jgi:hypothetical protein
MRSVALLALALVVAGCSGGGREPSEPASDGARPAPAWLDAEFADGTISFRYPDSWERSKSEKYGTLLSDNRSLAPAFVSVRYFSPRALAADANVGERAGRILRPRGRGLTLLYTQTARLGGLRGVEATFVWQLRSDTPLGPTFRTFVVELPSGRTAFLVFAAQAPRFHGAAFGWIRKTIRWTDVPGRAAGAVIERQRRPPRGWYISSS